MLRKKEDLCREGERRPTCTLIGETQFLGLTFPHKKGMTISLGKKGRKCVIKFTDYHYIEKEGRGGKKNDKHKAPAITEKGKGKGGPGYPSIISSSRSPV